MMYKLLLSCITLLVISLNIVFLEASMSLTSDVEISGNVVIEVQTFSITSDNFNLVTGETLYMFFDTTSYYGPPGNIDNEFYLMTVHSPEQCETFKTDLPSHNPNISFAPEILYPPLPTHAKYPFQRLSDVLRSPDEYSCLSFKIKQDNPSLKNIEMSVTRYGVYPVHDIKIIIFREDNTFRAQGSIEMNTFTHTSHQLVFNKPISYSKFGQHDCITDVNDDFVCNIHLQPDISVVLDHYKTIPRINDIGYVLSAVDELKWEIQSCTDKDNNPIDLTYEKQVVTDESTSKNIASFIQPIPNDVDRNTFDNFEFPALKCMMKWVDKKDLINWSNMHNLGPFDYSIVFFNRVYTHTIDYEHSALMTTFNIESKIENNLSDFAKYPQTNLKNVYHLIYTPVITNPIFFYLHDCDDVKFTSVDNLDGNDILPAHCIIHVDNSEKQYLNCNIDPANVGKFHQIEFNLNRLNDCTLKATNDITTAIPDDSNDITHLFLPQTTVLSNRFVLNYDEIKVDIDDNTSTSIGDVFIAQVVDEKGKGKVEIVSSNLVFLDTKCHPSYKLTVEVVNNDSNNDDSNDNIEISTKDVQKIYTLTADEPVDEASILSCLIHNRFNHFPNNENDLTTDTEIHSFDSNNHENTVASRSFSTHKSEPKLVPKNTSNFAKELIKTTYSEDSELSDSKWTLEFNLQLTALSSYMIEKAGVQYTFIPSDNFVVFQECKIDHLKMNSTKKDISKDSTPVMADIFSYKDFSLPFVYEEDVTIPKTIQISGVCSGSHTQTDKSKTTPPTIDFTFNVHGKKYTETITVPYITPPPPSSDSYEIISSHLNVTSKDSLTPDEIQKILDQYKDKVKEELTGGVNVEEGVYIDDIEETRSVDSIHTDITVNVDLETVGGGSDLESVENINDNFSDSFDQVFVDKGWKVEVSPPTVTKIPKHCRTGCGVGCLCEEGKPCTADNECKTNHCKFETSGFISHFSSHSVSHSENGQTGVCAQFKDSTKDNGSLAFNLNHLYLVASFVILSITGVLN